MSVLKGGSPTATAGMNWVAYPVGLSEPPEHVRLQPAPVPMTGNQTVIKFMQVLNLTSIKI